MFHPSSCPELPGLLCSHPDPPVLPPDHGDPPRLSLHVYQGNQTPPSFSTLSAQVVQEYERAVIFRLGRLRKGRNKIEEAVTVNNEIIKIKMDKTIHFSLLRRSP